jgi:hypothetical protein
MVGEWGRQPRDAPQALVQLKRPLKPPLPPQPPDTQFQTLNPSVYYVQFKSIIVVPTVKQASLQKL